MRELNINSVSSEIAIVSIIISKVIEVDAILLLLLMKKEDVIMRNYKSLFSKWLMIVAENLKHFI